MRKLVYLLTFLVAQIGFSQVYETGISYNLGKILGENIPIFPIQASGNNFGIILKKNMNPRVSYRLALNHIESKNTVLTEISGGIDFNFKNYNLVRTKSDKKSAKYLIFELAALRYQPPSREQKYTFAIPMGIGYKKAFTKHLVYSLEAKTRFTFKDDLDKIDPNKDNIDTNKSTNDAYYYISASIYYTFGWPRGSKNQTRF